MTTTVTATVTQSIKVVEIDEPVKSGTGFFKGTPHQLREGFDDETDCSDCDDDDCEVESEQLDPDYISEDEDEDEDDDEDEIEIENEDDKKERLERLKIYESLQIKK
jgi:hypothetical protein